MGKKNPRRLWYCDVGNKRHWHFSRHLHRLHGTTFQTTSSSRSSRCEPEISTVMNLRIPLKVGNCSIRWGPVWSPGRILVHSYLVEGSRVRKRQTNKCYDFRGGKRESIDKSSCLLAMPDTPCLDILALTVQVCPFDLLHCFKHHPYCVVQIGANICAIYRHLHNYEAVPIKTKFYKRLKTS